MITNEELFDLMLSVDQNTKRIPPGIRLLADAIYQLGRQHQRESDAALCENNAYSCARAIRASTGELK